MIPEFTLKGSESGRFDSSIANRTGLPKSLEAVSEIEVNCSYDPGIVLPEGEQRIAVTYYEKSYLFPNGMLGMINPTTIEFTGFLNKFEPVAKSPEESLCGVEIVITCEPSTFTLSGILSES